MLVIKLVEVVMSVSEIIAAWEEGLLLRREYEEMLSRAGGA